MEGTDSMTSKPSSSEIERIKEYLERLAELQQEEPPMFADIEHDTEPTEEWEDWNRREIELLDEYEDVVRSALLYYVKTAPIGGESRQVADILKSVAYKPDTALPPLGYLMNASQIQSLTRVLASGGNPRNSIVTRSEKWETKEGKNSITFKRSNRGEVHTLTITNPEILFPGITSDKRKRGTTITRKLLPFVLQKMTQQNYPAVVRIELSELVELGAYQTVDGAYKAITRFVQQMATVDLSWTRKSTGRGKKKEPTTSSGGSLFYHRERKGGTAFIYVNQNINIQDLASTWTVFPRWAYALRPGAFDLVHYIFFLARQNTRQISDNDGRFNISMQAIAESMGLPSVDEVKNRRHRQQIRTPIEKAIEEVEERVAATPEAKGLFFITPYVDDGAANIETWLSTGYVEVQLRGEYATSFTTIAAKQKELVMDARKAREASRKSARKDVK